MTEPEFATFRDLVEVVEKVDTKLDDHRVDIERRLGRIEKGLAVVAVLALAPHFSSKSVPLLEGALHGLSHIL